jgi:hypothetical protein
MPYIDTKYLGKCETCRHHSNSGCDTYCDHGEEYSPNLSKIPTADVVEVKRGNWEINCDGYYPYCSNCMTEPKSGVMSKYCPECGAKMDGGAK